MKIRNVLLITAGLLLAWGYGSIAELQERGDAPVPIAASREISGKVIAVDPRARELTVKTGMVSSKRFLLSAGALIQEGEKFLRLSDVKAGDSVTVRYVQQGGRDVAQEISIAGIRG